MPHAKVLKPFMDKGTNIVSIGSTIEGSSTRIKELEKKGLVVPLVQGDDASFRQRQLGGQTGEAVPAPSSPVVQPLTSKTLVKSIKKGRKSKSSQ